MKRRIMKPVSMPKLTVTNGEVFVSVLTERDCTMELCDYRLSNTKELYNVRCCILPGLGNVSVHVIKYAYA